MDKVTYLEPAQAAGLLCLDYNMAPVGTLTYASVGVSGEPASHRARLARDVARRGVKNPVIVQVRAGKAVLVEGHHRTVLSIQHRFAVPARVHYCTCDASVLDYFGLCPVTLDACAHDRGLARANRWDWTDHGAF